MLAVGVDLEQTYFSKGAVPGVGLILPSTLNAKLIIRVRFAAQTEISKCYYRVSVIWLRNGSP